jgi:hypothetical protein
MSEERFTVDGMLIQAWGLAEEFCPKDGPDDDDGANFHAQKRSNKTNNQSHAAISEPEPRNNVRGNPISLMMTSSRSSFELARM